MKCHEIRELLLTDYLDDMSSDDQKARVNGHLSGCPSCQAYLSRARQLEGDLQSSSAGDVPGQIWDNIREKIETVPVPFFDRIQSWWEEVQWGFRPSFVYASAVAAMLVVLVVVVPLASGTGGVAGNLDRAPITQLAYLDEDDSFMTDAEQAGSGTVLEHWL